MRDYLDMLTVLWLGLRKQQQSQRKQLPKVIVDSVQELAPGLGVTKSLIALIMTKSGEEERAPATLTVGVSAPEW